jgi:hypothetical protein
MNTINRSLVALLVLLTAIPCFSQDTKTDKKTESTKEQKTDGLRKISSSHHDWDFDVNIDEKALEANIEAAIERAMRSVDVALEKLEINIDPIEINLGYLKDADPVGPIKINIPNLNINIDPIEVPEIDIDEN